MTYLRKPKADSCLVTSNFNRRLIDEGDFSKSLSWVGWDRYNTADKMLAKIKSENDLTVKFMAAVPDAAHQESPDGSRSTTIYSEIYDPQNLRIYLFDSLMFNDMSGSELTWRKSLDLNYTDGILVLHKGRSFTKNTLARSIPKDRTLPFP